MFLWRLGCGSWKLFHGGGSYLLHAYLSWNYELSNCKFALLNLELELLLYLVICFWRGKAYFTTQSFQFLPSRLLASCRWAFKSVQVDTLGNKPFLSSLTTILSNLPLYVCNFISSCLLRPVYLCSIFICVHLYLKGTQSAGAHVHQILFLS